MSLKTSRFSYYLELKDYKWKNKRKEILLRDKNTCQRCGKHNNLQVHHIQYDYTLKAWEYKNEWLITLCSVCHEKETKDMKSLRDIIKDMLLSGFFSEEIKNRLKVK